MTASRALPTFVAAAAAALLLAGPAGAQVDAPPTAHRTTRAHTSVGAAHWYLTVVYRGTRTVEGYVDPTSERLVLVSPAGETRTVFSQKVSPRQPGFSLLDWSSDGSTALLSDGSGKHQRAIRVDVATGAAQTTPIPGDPVSMVLAPDGRGLVVDVLDGSSPPYDLQEVSWSGAVTDLHLDTLGPLLAGPADTVVIGAKMRHRHTLRVVSLTSGTVLHSFRTSAPCTPVRWWDDDHILATCGSYLHLIDAMTGAETALTSRADRVHESGYIDGGHVDARRIGSGLYVQVVGACGTTYVTHRPAHGSLQPLHVPGAIGNVVMVDGVGKELVIEHMEDCDGDFPREVLSRYQPVTRVEQPLMELAPNEEFGRLLVHGETHASVS